MEEGGSYVVPVHEFSKSAILGDYSHYHEGVITGISTCLMFDSLTDANTFWLP